MQVVLRAITADEIGRIAEDEGKPIFRIVGEVKEKTEKKSIRFSTVETTVREKAKFRFISPQLKMVLKYLGWTTEENFAVDSPSDNLIVPEFSNMIWIESVDSIKASRKVVFSEHAITPILEVVDDPALHPIVFGKSLVSTQIPSRKPPKPS